MKQLKMNFKPVSQRLCDDCVRCAVASIFGLDSDQVPHFYRLGVWYVELQKWINGYGWTTMIESVEDTPVNLQHPDDYYMGNWTTEKAAHALVMQHGKVVWNPSGASVKSHHNNLIFLRP